VLFGCARGKLHGSIRRTLVAVLLDNHAPDDFAMVSAPLRSVMVIIVLLNDAKIWAIPHFRSAIIYVTLRRSLASRNVDFAERRSDVVSDERLLTCGENVAWNGYSTSCDCDMSVDNKLPGVLG